MVDYDCPINGGDGKVTIGELSEPLVTQPHASLPGSSYMKLRFKLTSIYHPRILQLDHFPHRQITLNPLRLEEIENLLESLLRTLVKVDVMPIIIVSSGHVSFSQTV